MFFSVGDEDQDDGPMGIAIPIADDDEKPSEVTLDGTMHIHLTRSITPSTPSSQLDQVCYIDRCR